MIDIKDIDGNILLSTPINVGSKRRYTLMKEDYILLKFSLVSPISFWIGSKVDDTEIGLFEVTDTQKPKFNTRTGGYDYELRLDNHYWKWKNKIFKYTPENPGNEATWDLTATLGAHLSIFIRNLEALGYKFREQSYTFVIDSSVASEAKLISYSNTNMLDALTNMAEAWGCEWWVEDNVIHFGRCEYGTAVALSLDNNVADMTAQESKNTYATRIYAFGSTRNLPANYRPLSEQAVINGIVQKRLMLPEGTPYIDSVPDLRTEEAVEQVVIFENIYPRTDGHISSIVTYEGSIEDEEGNITTETFYRFTDSGFVFSEDYLLPNTELRMVFQSGALNGMDFGVKFNPNAEAEKLPDGSINPDAQLFEIVVNEDYGRRLPDGSLIPAVGDTYVLYGWDSTKIADLGLVDAAQEELKAEAERYVEQTQVDPNTYVCKMMSDWVKETGTTTQGKFLNPLTVGDRVTLYNDVYFKGGSRQSRIIGIEYHLDIPYDTPIYTVGETTAYSRLGELEKSIENLTIGGQTYTGSSGSSVYIIGSSDPTTPTNRNAFSALRSLKEFLSKQAPDRTPFSLSVGDRLNAEKGAHFGDFVQGQFIGRGGAVDGSGNAEFESIVSRSYLKVMEIIYNRLNAQEGDTSFSDFGTVDAVYARDDGLRVVQLRKRWDGDFTAFQPGDIIYGYVNDLDKADGMEFYKAWAWIESVDRAGNQLVIAEYPDNAVPSGKNHPLAEGMNVTRWGNVIEPEENSFRNPDYSLVIGKRPDGSYYNKRQQTFYISTDDGNIVELMGVNKPIPEKFNYGTVLGKIPDGLLDPKTQELINPDQPYLYARGIVVQDLIRINYKGVPTRTANYRGQWNAQTAASPDDYYNTTATTYDTVTWDGALWQCVVSGSVEEPTEQNPSWLKMTSGYSDIKELQLWVINPSANIVSVRNDIIEPAILSATVTLNSTEGAPVTFMSNLALYDAGARLFYSYDGIVWKRFTRGVSGPLDLEDKTDVIELEDSVDGSLIFTVGGEDIDTSTITDRIYFELRAVEDGTVLAKTEVPVVKDGANGEDGKDGISVRLDPPVLELKRGTSGVYHVRIYITDADGEHGVSSFSTLTDEQKEGFMTVHYLNEGGYTFVYDGKTTVNRNIPVLADDKYNLTLQIRTNIDGLPGRDGLLVYPAGNYSPDVVYTAKDETCPVVLDGEEYFRLKNDTEYYGKDADDDRKTPSLDANKNDDDTVWVHFDRFDSIFAKIIMADFAKLGQAVFYRNWMISQSGVDNTGTPSMNYKDFKTGDFTPNIAINFEDGVGSFKGHIEADSGVFRNVSIEKDCTFSGLTIKKPTVITPDNYEDFLSEVEVSPNVIQVQFWLEKIGTLIEFRDFTSYVNPSAALSSDRKYVGNTILIYNHNTVDNASVAIMGKIAKDEVSETTTPIIYKGEMVYLTCKVRIWNGEEQIYWEYRTGKTSSIK